MAFLPTMSLFLLAAVNNASEEPVVDTNIEEQQEEIVDETAQGAFASCMEGTEWAAADAKNGPLTAKDTCESTFAFEECLTYPADAKKCCPHVCNSEHICTGESFENVSDDVDAASNAVTECLENTYEPSAFAFWRWGATWRRAKYNNCGKVYAAGYTPETDISVALCCPNPVTSTEEPAAEEPAAEEEVAARMLVEAEAETESEDEAEAEVFANAVPHYGQELREMMCVGGPVTTSAGPVDPNAPETTKAPNSGDKPNSASTFGFTALALMLVTA